MYTSTARFQQQKKKKKKSLIKLISSDNSLLSNTTAIKQAINSLFFFPINYGPRIVHHFQVSLKKMFHKVTNNHHFPNLRIYCVHSAHDGIVPREENLINTN